MADASSGRRANGSAARRSAGPIFRSCPISTARAATASGRTKARQLGQWLARANERPRCRRRRRRRRTSLEGMTQVAGAVQSGMFKREYRDHRLEWMIRSGGLDVVLEGLQEQQYPLLERTQLTNWEEDAMTHEIIFHNYPNSPFSREGARRVRDQEAVVALGDPAGDHAQARSHPADRRLSQDSGDADRRRHLLRHADHPARAGAALSRRRASRRRTRARPTASASGPTGRSSRRRSRSSSARSATWCRRISRRTARR